MQFEAVSQFDAGEGMILKHEARRWSSVNSSATNGERK
jgi:hypothetical protein